MKLFKLSLILGSFLLLNSANLHAVSCSAGSTGKIVSLEQGYCGNCAVLTVNLTNCSFVSLPIMSGNLGTQPQSLAIYAMDRQKTITVGTPVGFPSTSTCVPGSTCSLFPFKVTY